MEIHRLFLNNLQIDLSKSSLFLKLIVVILATDILPPNYINKSMITINILQNLKDF